MARNMGWGVVVLAALAGTAATQTSGGASGPWVMERSGTTAGLRGIHAVSATVVWASGTDGTILRTVDDGATWQHCATPPGAQKLDFRGIWAWDAKTAIAMSSGPGDASRLYKTTDGCQNWKLMFTNPDKDGFWDAMNCADQADCFILGDPVARRFALFQSDQQQGQEIKWMRTPDNNDLKSTQGEGAFAASNSALMINWVDGPMLFGTGGPLGARTVCDACDGGCGERVKLAAIDVPSFPSGGSAGIFSIDYRDWRHIVAVGGDYMKPNDSAGTAAWSADGGKTWHAAAKPPNGYRSAVAWDARLKAWITVGTNGSDISHNDGKTWVPLDNGNWNALSLPWAAGPDGRIGKLDPGKLKK